MINLSLTLILSVLVTSGIAQDKALLRIDSLFTFWVAADFSFVTCKVDASAFGPVSHPDNLRPSGIFLTAGDGLCGSFDRDEVNNLANPSPSPSQAPLR